MPAARVGFRCPMISPVRSAQTIALVLLTAASTAAYAQATRIPTPEEAEAAKRDVWGEASIAQPNGPSYEFF